MLPKFPSLDGRELPRGLSSFHVSPAALQRWNPAIVAKEGEEETSISIFDVIGETWDGAGVTARRVAAILRNIGPGKTVAVYINSPGGDLFEGMAIYNLLRDYKGTIIIRVVGLAASAASIVAMAGAKIQTARAGFIMIHNCWVIALGNRNELREVADFLEPFDDAMADVYAARTKKKKKYMSELMDKETWFSGSQAIAEGFADEYLPADQVAEKDDEAAASRRAYAAELAKRAVEYRKGRAVTARPQPRADGVEIRAFTLDAVRVEDRDGVRQLVGHAAVFDKWSEDLGGFKERIAKGAFAKALGRDDIRALFNHDPNLVLGRNKAGTLKLSEDDAGLQVSIDLPDTSYARDLAVSIERGDVNQMSFAFHVTREGQEWEKAEGGLYLRTVNEVARLWDVSAVTYAAYTQTDAALRELDVIRAAEGEHCPHGFLISTIWPRGPVGGCSECSAAAKRQTDEAEAERKAQVARLAEIDL